MLREAKLIMLDAASLGRWVQKMHKAEIVFLHTHLTQSIGSLGCVKAQ
jgi:hypothetical protein